jgi:hypothetical protein
MRRVSLSLCKVDTVDEGGIERGLERERSRWEEFQGKVRGKGYRAVEMQIRTYAECRD